eukprot:TRINITY_DN3976_c1_g1_i4.p1 TRINITY_DN3976_c1_g1~~TRINITY_DN3976_c1_g1_i4.p1  ORF type:complete len:270 (+),score=67.69 TRINITY_DN3976_c1_g1_i4:65-874(+)
MAGGSTDCLPSAASSVGPTPSEPEIEPPVRRCSGLPPTAPRLDLDRVRRVRELEELTDPVEEPQPPSAFRVPSQRVVEDASPLEVALKVSGGVLAGVLLGGFIGYGIAAAFSGKGAALVAAHGGGKAGAAAAAKGAVGAGGGGTEAATMLGAGTGGGTAGGIGVVKSQSQRRAIKPRSARRRSASHGPAESARSLKVLRTPRPPPTSPRGDESAVSSAAPPTRPRGRVARAPSAHDLRSNSAGASFRSVAPSPRLVAAISTPTRLRLPE